MRSLIALLPLLSLISGCDKQSASPQQANEASVAPTAPTAADKLDRSHKGEAAPDYAFTDAKGARHTLADFRGKPVLVNLWATWCAPCVKEMPTLDALAVRESGRLHIVAISQDFDPANARAFFDRATYKSLALYLDTDTAFSMGFGANLPMTILYDASGQEVWRVLGEYDWAVIEAKTLYKNTK